MDIVFDTYRSSLFTAIELGIFFGSIGVVVAPSMIYAAFSLGITLLSIAFVYLLFNADLLAAAQVLVYIGAINVLIVFAIMLVGPAPLLPSRPLAYRVAMFWCRKWSLPTPCIRQYRRIVEENQARDTRRR